MNKYKADIHIHTVLSPCGDVEMSPMNIINKALEKGLDIIGITDHNSTLNCRVIAEAAADQGIFVMCGAEVTTQEEVHCLAFFENPEKLQEFQLYLEAYLPQVPNQAEKFGHQLVVDEKEQVLAEVDCLLILGISRSLEQVEKKVHSLGGLFIAAHADKKSYSVLSQLGFFPDDVHFDAVEVAFPERLTASEHKMLSALNVPLITNSDAHYIHLLGNSGFNMELETRSFEEIRKAFAGIEGRRIISL